MNRFLGLKYKLESSDNFDNYMKAMGVGLMTRKVGATVSPVVELKKEGDTYVLTSTSTFKNMTTKFQPGVEFDDETADGRKVKSIITIAGDTITEVQTDQNGKVSTIERTFSDQEIKMVLKVDDVICTRVYKLQG
ncbi:myelin P2 protein isoform X2 [Onthophagus taurus]|uniref:myelin P2 protein isoform X2 n=1 Tax=Onthophagus taurus TaxID=166361 RepID=UPI000C20A5A4|nr:myelin P2 protein isoform X2 [Onthophagus taurus]